MPGDMRESEDSHPTSRTRVFRVRVRRFAREDKHASSDRCWNARACRFGGAHTCKRYGNVPKKFRHSHCLGHICRGFLPPWPRSFIASASANGMRCDASTRKPKRSQPTLVPPMTSNMSAVGCIRSKLKQNAEGNEMKTVLRSNPAVPISVYVSGATPRPHHQ
jgi:hypothetical protein